MLKLVSTVALSFVFSTRIWARVPFATKVCDELNKNNNAGILSDSITQVLNKEIGRSEESLRMYIGWLIGKEMDKQRECLVRLYFDEQLKAARAHKQAEDMTRQEKILKLISTELARNATCVVRAHS
jgi:hypothetical protein